jgi:ligand-binding sensor domain-containing protein
VNALAFDVYGKLWAATDSLAYQYNGTAWSPIGSASNYGVSPITTHLAADPKGGMWIGSYGKGLLFHKQGAFKRQFNLAVNTLQVMPSGTVLVGRHAKLARIPAGSNSYETIDDAAVVRGDWSEGAYEDVYGGLWIGHVDEMSYRAPNGTWSAFGSSVVGASSANGLYRFLQTDDGSFYVCGNYKTFLYTDKLEPFPAVTPDPETIATGIESTHPKAIGFHISQRQFFLNAPGSHTVEFRAMDGTLRAHHIVGANTGLPMPQGLSVVRVKDAQGTVVLSAKVLNSWNR